MVTAGSSRPWLAVISLVLLLHAGSAARLSAANEGFDVLGAIQDEVETMNTNLDDLSAAIDDLATTTVAPSPTTASPPTSQNTDKPASTSAPTTQPPAPTTTTTKATTTAPPKTTEPTTTPKTSTTPKASTTEPTTTPKASTTEPTTTPKTSTTEPTTTPKTSTTEPSTTTEAPTTSTQRTTSETTTASTKTSTTDGSLSFAPGPSIALRNSDDKNGQLFLSRKLLSFKLGDIPCSTLKDIEATLSDAQEALDLVYHDQLANSTLEKLQESNSNLNFTTSCIERREITPANVTAVKASISAAEKSGEAASNAIDTIVNPPTPAPEDDSGFRSATIALGVLFSLAVVALIGMGVYAQRQKSGGQMS